MRLRSCTHHEIRFQKERVPCKDERLRGAKIPIGQDVIEMRRKIGEEHQHLSLALEKRCWENI